MKKTEKILIIDDHPVFLTGIAALLERIIPCSEIVTASNGKDALLTIQDRPAFDWIFLDIILPDITGTDLLKKFLEIKLLANIIVVSSDDSAQLINDVIERRADGFISKQFNHKEFENCISTIEQGDIYLSMQHKQQLKNYREGVYAERNFVKNNLSERQKQALLMIAKGYSNQEISLQMKVTQSTVKSHVARLMDLFDADNRTHCVAEARRLGILD